MYAAPISRRLPVAALTALSVLFSLAGVLPGTANAQRATSPAPVATAARLEVQARTSERQSRRLRFVMRRVCVAHRRPSARCLHIRHLLAHVDARTARLHRLATPKTSKHASTSTSGSGSTTTGTTSSTPSTGSSSTTSASSTESTPASSGTQTTTGGEPTTTGTTSTAGTTEGASGTGSGSGSSSDGSSESPSSAPSSFQPGLDSGTEPNDYTATTQLGAKLVRIEFSIGTTAAQMQPVISSYAAIGVRVLPLAGFYGTLPTAAQAQNLASWAKAYGPGGTFWAGRTDGSLAIQSIEFGNETSYGYQYGDSAESASYTERAETYARRFKEAAEAISATGIKVGLLAQADDWTGTWVSGMFAAVPNLGSYVAGWTIHPYGTSWEGRLQDLLEQTAAHGAPSSIPVDITEWGVATDNGRCLSDNDGWNKCMSYAEAATTLTNTVGGVRHLLGSRLGMFILYQVRDQQATGTTTYNQAYFGALQNELQPKGAYTTAVETLLSSS